MKEVAEVEKQSGLAWMLGALGLAEQMEAFGAALPLRNAIVGSGTR